MGMPLKILQLFPLLRRHAVIRDPDGEVWLFQEHLENGTYSRYSLRGELLSRIGRPKAVLFAELRYNPDPEAIHVFLEDIRTFKPGVGIGTWMLNRAIDVLKRAAMVLPIGIIYGTLSPVDEQDPVNKARRDHFFTRSGFRILARPVPRAHLPAERQEQPAPAACERTIEAQLHELRFCQPAYAQALEEMDVPTVIREWAIDRWLKERR